MSDDPQPEFFRRIVLTMEYEVICSLLSGNDTCCFSTKQYVEARSKWIQTNCGSSREELGLGDIDEYELETGRRQLRSVPTLIREVDADVWAALIDPTGG